MSAAETNQRLVAILSAHRLNFSPHHRIGDMRAVPGKQVFHAVYRGNGNMIEVPPKLRTLQMNSGVPTKICRRVWLWNCHAF